MLSLITHFLVSVLFGKNEGDTEQPIKEATEKLKKKSDELQRLQRSVSKNEFQEIMQLFSEEITVTNRLNDLRLKKNKYGADKNEIRELEEKKAALQQSFAARLTQAKIQEPEEDKFKDAFLK